MGQYHFVVNVTKRQYLHSHKFNEGVKLMEFVSGGDTLRGLALLLACSNGRGGGDYCGEDPLGLVGSWAGDRIAIIGDYYERGDLPLDIELPEGWFREFEDISSGVVNLVAQI